MLDKIRLELFRTLLNSCLQIVVLGILVHHSLDEFLLGLRVCVRGFHSRHLQHSVHIAGQMGKPVGNKIK